MDLILMLPARCRKDENNNQTKTITDQDGNVYISVTIGVYLFLPVSLKCDFRDKISLKN